MGHQNYFQREQKICLRTYVLMLLRLFLLITPEYLGRRIRWKINYFDYFYLCLVWILYRSILLHACIFIRFSDCSVFLATFTTAKVYNLKSHKNFVLKTIHFTTCFSYTEPSSGELNLLVETSVLFALGMVPASYIFCAWGDHLPPLCCVTVILDYKLWL
jgi:hypothetical protein